MARTSNPSVAPSLWIWPGWGCWRWSSPRATGLICVRSVWREAIAYHSAMADSVFAMQGTGTAAIRAFGTEAQKARYRAPRARQAIHTFLSRHPWARDLKYWRPWRKVIGPGGLDFG